MDIQKIKQEINFWQSIAELRSGDIYTSRRQDDFMNAHKAQTEMRHAKWVINRLNDLIKK